MNRIITVTGNDASGCNTITRTCDMKEWNGFTQAMAYNNTYCPAITKVIFSRGTKTVEVKKMVGRVDADGKPVEKPTDAGKLKAWMKLKIVWKKSNETRNLLVTRCEFADGTKVKVLSSEGEQIFDADGNVLETAKVSGIAMALAKRMLGSCEVVKDKNGNEIETNEIYGNGFGRRIDAILKSSYDCQESPKKADEARKAKKAANLAKQKEIQEKAAKRRAEHPSQYALLKQMADGIAAIQGNK